MASAQPSDPATPDFARVEACVRDVVQQNTPTLSQQCIGTLKQIVELVRGDPAKEVYRKLNTSTDNFAQRFGCVQGSQQLLEAMGFQRRTSKLLFFAPQQPHVLGQLLASIDRATANANGNRTGGSAAIEQQMPALEKVSPEKEQKTQTLAVPVPQPVDRSHSAEDRELARRLEEEDRLARQRREEEELRLLKEMLAEEERQQDRERAAKMAAEEKATAELLRKMEEDEKNAAAERARVNAEAERKNQELLQKAFKGQKDTHAWITLDEFDCPICMDTVPVGGGIELRGCAHKICKECFKLGVKSAVDNGDYPVVCTQCKKPIRQEDIIELAGKDMFDKLEERMINKVESATANSFHCMTKNCPGWCIIDGDRQKFLCRVCDAINCLACKAIHEPKMTCKEYQYEINKDKIHLDDEKKTKEEVDRMIKAGEAFLCPGCKAVVTKASGCDWLQCYKCKMELCWATKQARWGPGGHGDTSGGCRCGVNGKRCHPNCGNCH